MALDYHIDWNDSSENIVRFINATGYPYAGAFSWIDDCKVNILDGIVINDIKLEQRHVGKVMFVDGYSPIVIAAIGLADFVSSEHAT